MLQNIYKYVNKKWNHFLVKQKGKFLQSTALSRPLICFLEKLPSAGVEGLYTIGFNTIRNELLNKFLRDVVKISKKLFEKVS